MSLLSPFRLLVLLPLLGCISPTEAIGSTESAVFNGQRETGRAWTVAVVNFDRGSGGGLCSGTLIAPNVVLTAKHCIWHALDGDNYAETALDRLEVRVGDHAVDGVLAVVSVTAALSTPGVYRRDRIWEGEDIALLRLETDVSAVPRRVSTSAPEVGAAATLVGYGVHDDAFTVGPKYTGETRIEEVGAHLLRTHGDSWTCQGDSGGPLLVDGVVVGVTSAGRGGCVRDAQHYYTLLAPHRALIASFVGEAGCAISPAVCRPGTTDAGTPDAGLADVGLSDALPVDVGSLDGNVDTMGRDTGCAVIGTSANTRSSMGVLCLLGWLLWVRRRDHPPRS